MLTVREQQHSFSTHEWVFQESVKGQSFWDRKCLEGDSNPPFPGHNDLIPTFGNRCLSAIGGGKQRSRFAGWVQLSAEAAPGRNWVPPAPPCAENSGAAD